MKVECWGFSYRISLEWLFSHTWKNRVRNDLFWMIPLRQNSHWDSHSQRARRKWNQVGMLKTREFTQQTVLIDGRFSKPPKGINPVDELRGLCWWRPKFSCSQQWGHGPLTVLFSEFPFLSHKQKSKDTGFGYYSTSSLLTLCLFLYVHALCRPAAP